MSSPYCYLVFSPGVQPSIEEVELLDQCVSRAKQRYAVGVNADDGCLAFAFEVEGFRRDLSSIGRFKRLLQHWQERGCQLEQRLAFIKNPRALQPLPGGLITESSTVSTDKIIKQKQIAAREGLGRARLKLYNTIKKQAWIQSLGSAVPYLMMGCGGLIIIAAGILLGTRLSQTKTETRQDTIKRVASGAMDEGLSRQKKDKDDIFPSEAPLPLEE